MITKVLGTRFLFTTYIRTPQKVSGPFSDIFRRCINSETTLQTPIEKSLIILENPKSKYNFSQFEENYPKFSKMAQAIRTTSLLIGPALLLLVGSLGLSQWLAPQNSQAALNETETLKEEDLKGNKKISQITSSEPKSIKTERLPKDIYKKLEALLDPSLTMTGSSTRTINYNGKNYLAVKMSDRIAWQNFLLTHLKQASYIEKIKVGNETYVIAVMPQDSNK